MAKRIIGLEYRQVPFKLEVASPVFEASLLVAAFVKARAVKAGDLVPLDCEQCIEMECSVTYPNEAKVAVESVHKGKSLTHVKNNTHDQSSFVQSL